MRNLRAFHVYYLGPTNHRGGRVVIKDMRFKERVVLSYTYEFDDVAEIADNYLKTKGIICLYRSSVEKGYIMTTDNFTESMVDNK